MKANNVNGHIIHINSVAGHKCPDIPNLNVYTASKYAVTALTETLRQELNSINSKIKVTVSILHCELFPIVSWSIFCRVLVLD